MKDFDTIISALGREVIPQQTNLITWADECPTVTRFLPSEFGTDVEYNESSASERPHQQKLRVRAALRSAKELEYAFLVTGPYADVPYFLGAMKNPVGGSFDVQRRKAVLVGDGKGRVSLVACEEYVFLVSSSSWLIG